MRSIKVDEIVGVQISEVSLEFSRHSNAVCTTLTCGSVNIAWYNQIRMLRAVSLSTFRVITLHLHKS